MKGVKFSLFTKVIFWLFLNLLVLATILFAFFSYNFRLRPNSGFSVGFGSNIEAVTRQITNEVDEKTREERDAILREFSDKYAGVEFLLFDYEGNQLGGRETQLPTEILKEITRPEGRPPPPRNEFGQDQAPPERRPPPFRGMPPPPSIYLQTENPTLYWFVARSMTLEKDGNEPIRTRLLAVSDSFYGYGLFFNPFPWIVLAGIIVAVSVLFWFPFVRNITKSLGQMTEATEHIAEEDFHIRISEKRSDELGRLGSAINHLAKRLSGFVGGQKRFLGDISHELNSPLARMNFALTILEDRVDEKNRAYVEDVKEEVELMSKLVQELLAYSKAGIKTAEVEPEKVKLLPLVKNTVEREAKEDSEIKVEIDENLEVLAQPELLSRAIANVVRNSIRYANDAGEILISAEKTSDNSVEIKITDKGEGVPENELNKIFDPLYRVQTDRSRETGGSGLGLAIVKTCIEACQGKVRAENLEDGFTVMISLKAV